MSTSAETATAIRPFRAEFSEDQIGDLRRRIATDAGRARSWSTTGRRACSSPVTEALARYWLDRYDFGRMDARLNELPHFVTPDRRRRRPLHPRHLVARNALPLIMTHGWPGSVIELLDTVGPLTGPDRARRERRGCVPSRAALAPRVRALGRAGGDRLGSGPHRASLGRAHAPCRLYPLRRSGRRRGCRRHRRDGPRGTGGPDRHSHKPARAGAGRHDGGTRTRNAQRPRRSPPSGSPETATSSRWPPGRRRSATPCWTRRLPSPPGWSTTTRTPTTRSRAPSSTSSPRATSPATTSSTTSPCTG